MINLPDPRALTERHNSYWLKLHQSMCELQHLGETLINTTACCRQAGQLIYTITVDDHHARDTLQILKKLIFISNTSTNFQRKVEFCLQNTL